MTRINSAINPKTLTDQHLIAELRELPRIFTAVEKRIKNNILFNDIPKRFRLGTGHVKFFYNKTNFLLDRHKQLRNEYNIRFNKNWQYIPNFDYLQQPEYKPNEIDFILLKNRISSRIIESNQIPRYYSKSIEKNEAINLLNYIN